MGSLAEWNSLLASAGSRLVVVDAFATWCPPCKAAAPHYAALSDEFSRESVTFAKFNVDDAPDVRDALRISS